MQSLPAASLERVLKYAVTDPRYESIVAASQGRLYGLPLIGEHDFGVRYSRAEEAAEDVAEQAPQYAAARAEAFRLAREAHAKTEGDDDDDEEPFAEVVVDLHAEEREEHERLREEYAGMRNRPLATLGPEAAKRKEYLMHKVFFGRVSPRWRVILYDSGTYAIGCADNSGCIGGCVNDFAKAIELARAINPEAVQRYESAKVARDARKAEEEEKRKAAALLPSRFMAPALAMRVCRAWHNAVSGTCLHLLAHSLVMGAALRGRELSDAALAAAVPLAVRECVSRVDCGGVDFALEDADPVRAQAERTAQVARAVRAYPRLQSLGMLSGRISAEALDLIGAHAAELTSLTMSYAQLGGSADVLPVLRGCPNLAVVSLERCGLWVDDLLLKLLAAHCRNLRRFEAERAELLTAKGFVALAKGCPSLTELDVSRASLSAAAFKALGEHSSKLRVLSLRDCSGISAAGLRHLSGCAALRELELPGHETKSTRQVSSELKAAQPQLRITWPWGGGW